MLFRSEKERFARWAIRSEKTAGNDLTTEVGTKSRTDVFEGMDDNILKTSDAVTGSRNCTVGWWQMGSGGDGRREAIWLAMTDLTDEIFYRRRYRCPQISSPVRLNLKSSKQIDYDYIKSYATHYMSYSRNSDLNNVLFT